MLLQSIREYEEFAVANLPQSTYEYISSGAGSEFLLQENTNIFKKYRVIPRYLVNVSSIKTETLIEGIRLDAPIIVAPMATHKIVHDSGEIGTSSASRDAGLGFILSTLSSTSLEDVIQATGNDSLKWYQVYVSKNRSLTESLIKRAEISGYQAIVLTVDAPVLGDRIKDKRNKFCLPPNVTYANFTNKAGFNKPTSTNKYASHADSSFDWSHLEWLQSLTTLPIILKGVLHPEDALKAVKLGITRLIISNHGGRQLDCTPTALECLQIIKRYLSSQNIQNVDLYVDGGIKCGADIFKAICFGAKAVLVGRIVLWGLAYDGQRGAHHVLSLLKEQFINVMQLTGCCSIEDISRATILSEYELGKLSSE